jgi:hypothetical protein
MCFSAVASFAGGVIISAIGVATVMKVHKPSQIVFASIPLFFGFQQFVEAVNLYLFSYGRSVLAYDDPACSVVDGKR